MSQETIDSIKLEKLEAGYRLVSEMFIPAPLEEVFAFFSRAENLESITPPLLHFQFLAPPPQTMQAGRIIKYHLRIHGVPIRWVTEISAWEPPYRFADRQLRGPYRTWNHEHRFEARGEGTQMTDIVHYELPLGFMGRLAHVLFVEQDVRNIFRYRKDQIGVIFGQKQPTTE